MRTTNPTEGRRSSRAAQLRRRPRARQEQGLLPVLSRAVRGVEQAVQRARLRPSDRAAFQAVALLVREERERLKALDGGPADAALGRLDDVATALARVAVRDSTLMALLAEDAELLPDTRTTLAELRGAAGLAVDEDEEDEVLPTVSAAPAGQVVPLSVVRRRLYDVFLEPDYSAPPPVRPRTRRLVTWELLQPLLRSFERASGGAPSCMPLPEPGSLQTSSGRQLMPHQAQVVRAAAAGHRTFLLADEPGLGKTAQALLAAEAAGAYPLLVVVPSVVKANWAREVGLWTPHRSVSVVHGDGEDLDAFADVVVVNYDLLDRHVGWLGTFGFRGLVVDEAHFIKNKGSQRSRHVLSIAERVRARTVRPLMMALTGTPLINDVEDFLPIWELLGWVRDDEPGPELMAALEENGLTPDDPAFYPAARSAVIGMGIVRRRKVDVAADIPARRIADLPVELDGALGRSVREAERVLAQRMVERYERAAAARAADTGEVLEGVDAALVRKVVARELQDGEGTGGENVFSMLRRIGQAKAALAADYTAQLARSVGKVVFFAKHVDVMDAAEQALADRGLRTSSVRGDQTPAVRQANVDAFVNDPDVAVAVCSLTAAGVGLNLQVASDVVLAELSWTDAEQTQAVDRVHRIGQDRPVTAWRVIAAQTLDARIAELLDRKAGLAARALDGSDEEVATSVDVRTEALVSLLTDALQARARAREGAGAVAPAPWSA